MRSLTPSSADTLSELACRSCVGIHGDSLALVWFADADVPLALVEAQREGSLVIFVGAGASMGAPSSLPDFRTLTAAIAADASVTPTPEELNQPDILLGDLGDRHGVDVHLRVASIVGVTDSRPNALHAAIAELASAGPAIRVVTTNYDLHLSRSLRSLGRPFTEHAAPALPLGDDFDGIVYLHGSLSGPNRRLVVTDADFGQAYLRDAWATKFLERMFSTYKVLFIGYSHKDVVMSYLARGLRPDSDRFALTDDAGSPHWRRLQITPISYPNTDRTHSALTTVIRSWASRAAMGLLEQRAYIADLLAAPPSQVPEEMSYLEAVLVGEDTAGFFAEFARGPQWLAWASERPEFRRLFDPAWTGPPCSPNALARWFASFYVCDEEMSRQALALARAAGGQLSPVLWSEIGFSLHRQPDRPEWLSGWLVLLVGSAPETASPWLEYALLKSRWPEDRAAVLLLLDQLAEPHLSYEPSFTAATGTRIEIRLRGQEYELREAWEKILRPNITDAAPDVMVIADHYLRRIWQLLSAAEAARPGWDPVSFSRSAIEPHPQDDMPEPADFLINAARDCLNVLVDKDTDAGRAYLQEWADSDVPLLRRLAVHGWSRRTDVTGSAKLAWLSDRQWLFDHQLRHEVFGLIAAALPDADTQAADALVADAERGPVGSEHRDYESYNALVWITQHAPNLQSAANTLDRIRTAHPQFTERPYPDLNAWAHGGWVTPRPPMSAPELHRLIDENPASAVAELRQYKGASTGFDSPSWEGALNVLADVARDWPADGLTVLDTENGSAPDLFRAIIRGWEAAHADPATARRIVGRLARADLSAVAGDVARMLAGGGQNDPESIAWHQIPEARRLAARIWTMTGGAVGSVPELDWMIRALNHPAGQLAQFWVQAIAGDWTDAGETWPGIPEEIREQLSLMIATTDDQGKMAEVILASQLYFFHNCDQQFSIDHILPLLAWTSQDHALPAWEGYLTYGRFTDRMLNDGLLTYYLQAAAHADELPDNLRQQLYGHLADISLRSGIDLLANGWLSRLTSTTPAETRVGWMNHIGFVLSRMPGETVEQQWNRWIREYWRNRLASNPVQLTTPEASAMAAWTIYLTDSVQEAVSLATAHSAAITPHSRLLHDLTDERIRQQPTALAHLLTHLLRSTHPPFYSCHEIQRILQAMENAQPSAITPLREQALRLGCLSDL
jgi:hypothetical protein